MNEVEIIFEPDGRRVRIQVGTSLVNAANSAGVPIETPCSGLGTCGKCKVEFIKGMAEVDPNEQRLLTEFELSSGIRLACRHKVHENNVIFIPEGSRSLVQQILRGGVQRDVTLEPGIKKLFVSVPAPSLHDQRADLERLIGSIREMLDAGLSTGDVASDFVQDIEIDYALACELPTLLRNAKFNVTTTLQEPSHRTGRMAPKIISIEPGDTTTQNYGIAFDIGTTTVVGYLMDLNSGQELAVSSAMNPQMAYGDDLVSRIKYSIENKNGRRQLQRVIIKVVNQIIEEATQEAKVDPKNIYEMTIVGNTCMNHLFLGIDPSPLGFAPYVPVVRRSFEIDAHRLGIKICPAGMIHVLPNIASFVGADTVGVLLAHIWDGSDETRLAVDIGTNGETVLSHKGKLYACSAAAGPAFEGARISCGMRGSPGAINSITLNERLFYTTIDDRPPRGLCGSGLVDSVAQILDAGIIDQTGHILDPEEIPTLSDDIRERIISNAKGREFVLVPAEHSATGQALSLTQQDIRELQLAKGSMCASIKTLLKIAGVSLDEISALYLAGGFGNYIRKESALRIGLLPEIPIDRIQGVGNAAGVGAKLALLSRKERQLSEEIAQRVEHIELAADPNYHEELMETMLFP